MSTSESNAWKAQAVAAANANCTEFHNLIDMLDGVEPLVSPVPLEEGSKQIQQIFKTLFRKTDKICVGSSIRAKKLHPAHNVGLVASEELKNGAWFKVNRITADKPSGPNGGITDKDSATDYLIIEMDRASRDAQLQFWAAAISAGFPVISLTDSAGKSFHAIIRIAEPTHTDYRKTAERIMDLLEPFVPDGTSVNCSRFTRLPGVTRGEGAQKKAQELVYLNPAAPTWSWDAPVVKTLEEFTGTPVPDQVKSSVRRDAERRDRPNSAGDEEETEEFKRRLEQLLHGREIDLFEVARSADWEMDMLAHINGMEDKMFLFCPWVEDHTDGANGPTDTYLWKRTTGAKFPWGFKCSHDSCRRRKVLDFVAFAKEHYPDAFHDALVPLVDPDEVFNTLVGPDEAPPVMVDTPPGPVPPMLFGSNPSVIADERIFHHIHAQNVKCLKKEGLWFTWNGSRWEESELDVVCGLAADASVARKKFILDSDPEEAGKMLAAAERMREPRNLDAVVRSAKINKWPLASREDFDSNDFLVGCPNGTLDLRTGKLSPARRADLISKQTGFRYNPLAKAPTLKWALGGMFPDDLGVPGLLKRLFGYGLSGDMSHAILPIFYGPNGRNGKSLLLRVMSRIAGDYAGTAPKGFLEEGRGPANPDAASSSTMHLMGKRLFTINELPSSAFLDEAMAKHITGYDVLSGRPPFGKTVISFRPQAKMIMISNHKPKIRGVDPATWKRVKLITFNTSFNSKEDGCDLDLEDKLMAEAEGIFAWMVEGAVEWWNGGDKDLKIPAVVENDSAKYRDEEDPLNAFIDARCEDFRQPPSGEKTGAWEAEANKNKVSRDDLYKDYAAWATRNNFRPIWSSKMFKQRMDAAGFEGAMVHGMRFWRKINLKLHDLDDSPLQ